MIKINKEKELILKLEDFVSDPELAELESNLKIFNIMDIFNIKTSEIAISSFLAWLLNPSENHGLGDYFLKYFLIESIKDNDETLDKINPNGFNSISVDLLDLNKAVIKTEESFRDKKADIVIRVIQNKFLCIIENKVKSSESEDQTDNYAKLSKEKYRDFNYVYLFLTPDGLDADSNEFIPISYTDIKDLLLRTLEAKKNILNDEVIFLINQFIQNIEVYILKEGKIPDLCTKIYQRHKKAIDMIISNIPDYMDIINKELLKNYKEDEWTIYPTKRMCLIYKNSWLNDFSEFFYSKYPFFHYEVCSWEYDGLHISIEFHLEEIKNKGGRFEIRNKFTKILDDNISKRDKFIFPYQKNKRAVKFKKLILTEGYENDEDLINIAYQMDDLIRDTLESLEKCIESFKVKYSEDILTWKKELTK